MIFLLKWFTFSSRWGKIRQKNRGWKEVLELNKKLLLKLCGLNFGLAFVNILVFSGAFLGISLSDDTVFRRTVGITVLVMSVLAFFYGNYLLLKSPEAKYDYAVSDLDSPGALEDALEGLRDRAVLRPQIEASVAQLHTVKRKREGLRAVIYRKFKEEDEDTLGLRDVVESTEKLLYANIKKIINGAAVFDQKEFRRLNPNQQPQKYQVYMEQINYIKSMVAQNENILLEYDRLLMEVSKLSDGSGVDDSELDVLKNVVDNLRQM